MDKTPANSAAIFPGMMEPGSLLRTLVNQTPGMLYVFERSPQGEYSMPFVSDRVDDIFGVDADDVKEDFNILWKHGFEDHILNVRASIEESARTLEPWHLEFPYNHPRKGMLWLLGTSIPERLEDGTVRWFGCISDISKRRAMEEEKRELENHLRQAQRLETVGALAGNLAHDFNNILLAISGFTELALRDVEAGGSVAPKLDRVLQACQRAKALVAKLLLFSRREAPDFQNLRPQALVEETLELIRASMPATIKLDVRLHAGDVGIKGDEGQLQQVLMNLCNNAVHAMREQGGTLTLRLEKRLLQAEKKSCPPELLNGEYLVLGVGDSGSGIAPEHLGRLFDPCFTTKDKSEGTGLGLAIAHGIIKEHHGTVAVDSRVGVGTLFEVFLPVDTKETVARHAAAGSASPLPPPAPPASKRTLMLVDDERDLIEMQAQFLRDWGYRVVVFDDPVEALEAFRQNSEVYDILVTDQTMPELTGLQLADAMRNLKSTLPVILISGFSRDINPESLRQHAIAKFFKKPFSLSDLAREIDRQFMANCF